MTDHERHIAVLEDARDSSRPAFDAALEYAIRLIRNWPLMEAKARFADAHIAYERWLKSEAHEHDPSPENVIDEYAEAAAALEKRAGEHEENKPA